jgi:two-component system chemotaxis response regulator CheB
MVNLVVVGASAGGLKPLQQLVSGIHVPMRGAMCIVQHQSERFDSHLRSLLQQHTAVPVRLVDDADEIRESHIYVARPGYHLILSGQQMSLCFGPRVNGARPSIDILFHSAAVEFGDRAIGVLLSGHLDDGVSGMVAVQRAGGKTIVQDPMDAEVSSMPKSALKYMKPDRVLPAREIGAAINQLLQWTGEASPGAQGMMERESGDSLTKHEEVTQFSCPDCGGAMKEVNAGGPKIYKCHVGHARTSESLLAEQTVVLERALWYASRTLKEIVVLTKQLADEADETSDGASARKFTMQKQLAERHLSLLNDGLLKSCERGDG